MSTEEEPAGTVHANGPASYQGADAWLLERFQRAAFSYFLEHANPENGLVADRSVMGSPCSIAAVGLALSSYPIAIERGWMIREDAVYRTLITLRFFWTSQQSDEQDATGFKGFYYHFLDMMSGKRTWRCELSFIDSALLIAGVLTAGTYFAAPTPSEAEIRKLANALYHRIDWSWAQNGKAAVLHGWKPENGFLHYGWEGYNEAILLYVLGLGSPTHRLSGESFDAWTSTYQWENLYGHDFLYAGPLFVHQFSHAWLDFDGIQDQFMREKGSDYFENSRRAIEIQREYARRNPKEFCSYSEECWGLSACDGPGIGNLPGGGARRRVYGYVARGVPYGPDDGTLSFPSTFASLPFAPDLVLPTVRHIANRYADVIHGYKLPSGFNPTLTHTNRNGWVSEGYLGLDQGIVVLMIENHRSRLIWNILRQCAPIRLGLTRAGFTGGWLA